MVYEVSSLPPVMNPHGAICITSSRPIAVMINDLLEMKAYCFSAASVSSTDAVLTCCLDDLEPGLVVALLEAAAIAVAGGMVVAGDDFDRFLSPFLRVDESRLFEAVDEGRLDNLLIFATGATFSGTTNPPFLLLTDASGVSEWTAVPS